MQHLVFGTISAITVGLLIGMETHSLSLGVVAFSFVTTVVCGFNEVAYNIRNITKPK